jgi:hypothetical protein
VIYFAIQVQTFSSSVISLIVALVIIILRSGLIFLVIIFIFIVLFLIADLQTIVVLEFLEGLDCGSETASLEALLDGLFTNC